MFGCCDYWSEQLYETRVQVYRLRERVRASPARGQDWLLGAFDEILGDFKPVDPKLLEAIYKNSEGGQGA